MSAKTQCLGCGRSLGDLAAPGEPCEHCGAGTTCEWFAMCGEPATHYEPHPILGRVPSCDSCPRVGA